MTDDRSRMTDARLAEIKALLDDSRTAHAGTWPHDRNFTNGEVAALLAEVDRLHRELFAAYELLDEHHIQRELNPDKELYGVWKPGDDDLEAIRWHEWWKRGNR